MACGEHRLSSRIRDVACLQCAMDFGRDGCVSDERPVRDAVTLFHCVTRSLLPFAPALSARAREQSRLSKVSSFHQNLEGRTPRVPKCRQLAWRKLTAVEKLVSRCRRTNVPANLPHA